MLHNVDKRRISMYDFSMDYKQSYLIQLLPSSILKEKMFGIFHQGVETAIHY